MTLLHHLRLRNAAAPTALDWLCSVETRREILEAMTPQQFVVAALLIDGMTIKQIADELDITIQAVCSRRKMAKLRVIRALYAAGDIALIGDVMSRSGSPRKNKPRGSATCCDCGKPINERYRRCSPCANRENVRKRWEATP